MMKSLVGTLAANCMPMQHFRINNICQVLNKNMLRQDEFMHMPSLLALVYSMPFFSQQYRCTRLLTAQVPNSRATDYTDVGDEIGTSMPAN